MKIFSKKQVFLKFEENENFHEKYFSLGKFFFKYEEKINSLLNIGILFSMDTIYHLVEQFYSHRTFLINYRPNMYNNFYYIIIINI